MKNLDTLKHSPIDSLNSIEQEFIVKWFIFHMKYEQREKLMNDHPVMYNKLMGMEVMEVFKRGDVK